MQRVATFAPKLQVFHLDMIGLASLIGNPYLSVSFSITLLRTQYENAHSTS